MKSLTTIKKYCNFLDFYKKSVYLYYQYRIDKILLKQRND